MEIMWNGVLIALFWTFSIVLAYFLGREVGIEQSEASRDRRLRNQRGTHRSNHNH